MATAGTATSSAETSWWDTVKGWGSTALDVVGSVIPLVNVGRAVADEEYRERVQESPLLLAGAGAKWVKDGVVDTAAGAVARNPVSFAIGGLVLVGVLLGAFKARRVLL